ncbi:unnamed protein product, partial [Didymodactylos carnosus]
MTSMPSSSNQSSLATSLVVATTPKSTKIIASTQVDTRSASNGRSKQGPKKGSFRSTSLTKQRLTIKSQSSLKNRKPLIVLSIVNRIVNSVEHLKNLIQDNKTKTARKIARAIFSEQQLAQMSPCVDDLTQRLKPVVC